MKMYVLQVKSGCETSAYQQLKERGFDVLLPMKKEYIRKNGKWELFEKIIFTQYIFIFCDLTNKQTYYEIKKTDGVIRFLGNENGAEQFQGYIFEAMSEERPELYKEIKKFIKEKQL